MIVSSRRFRSFGESKLQWGSSGDSVRSLQKRLIALGVPNVSVTGQFDQQTLEAVKYFQLASGISANGVVDENTWTKIREAEGMQTGGAAGEPTPNVATTGGGFLDTLGTTLANLFKPSASQEPTTQYVYVPQEKGVPTWVWVAGGVGAAALLTLVAVSAGGRRQAT